jgi:hypothetical protein
MHGRKVIQLKALCCATSLCFLVGCATPTHTNALIFGTNTKVALDISSGSTGTLGLTLGYARQEAVFMPLMANKYDQQAGKLVPAECSSKTVSEPQIGQKITINPDDSSNCPSLFMGQESGGKRDAYSVLASFGGELDGSGQQAKIGAKGFVRSYFATGVAAQTLAAVGGAALVSTAATPPAEATLAAFSSSLNTEKISAIQANSLKTSKRITELVETLYKGAKPADELATWLSKEPASSLDQGVKNLLSKKVQNKAEFEKYLQNDASGIAEKLEQSSSK